MAFALQKWDSDKLGDAVCEKLKDSCQLLKNTNSATRQLKKNHQKQKFTSKSKIEKRKNVSQTHQKKVAPSFKTSKHISNKPKYKTGKPLKGNVVQETSNTSLNAQNTKKPRKTFADKKLTTASNLNTTKKTQKINSNAEMGQNISHFEESDTRTPSPKKPSLKTQQKIKELLQNSQVLTKKQKNMPLRDRMIQKLKAAKFRYINEQIYTTEGKTAQEFFENDPAAFCAYHEGYQQQLRRWQINPLDLIIESIKKMPEKYVIADFGCGEGKLSQSVHQKVHSFDLIAANECVTACDMAHVPLKSQSADVVVFCLSLMGTNLKDYFIEANRVLKINGIMKIAEVESRFDAIETFIEGVERFGFKNVWKDLTHNLFYFLDFQKDRDVKKKNKLPTISLHPCLYKKR